MHFVDGSAGEHNVPVDAFKIFFGDLAGTCDWLIKDGRRIDEIKLVFLGDIFDFLRTEIWFGYPEDERPWGKNEKRIEENANGIFDTIIRKNQDTFISSIKKAMFHVQRWLVETKKEGNRKR